MAKNPQVPGWDGIYIHIQDHVSPGLVILRLEGATDYSNECKYIAIFRNCANNLIRIC